MLKWFREAFALYADELDSRANELAKDREKCDYPKGTRPYELYTLAIKMERLKATFFRAFAGNQRKR